MVGDARAARVHVGAAELLDGDVLAGRGLDQGGPADEDRAGAAHDHRLVGHRGHVGAAGGAEAHDDGDLRDPLRRHPRLVVEDAPEVLAVGEDVGLERQVGAARVDQVEARQPVLLGDLLRAQVLLDRQRQVGAPLDGGVVGDDHAGAPLDDADPGDDPGRGRLALVDVPGGERLELQEGARPGRRAGRSAHGPAACPAPGAARAPRRCRPARRAPCGRAARRRAPPSARAGARTRLRSGRSVSSARPSRWRHRIPAELLWSGDGRSPASPGADPRGRAPRRLPERARARPDRGQAPPDRAARRARACGGSR